MAADPILGKELKMTHKTVQHILCGVLGKPTSRVTVTKAIDLALEHEARLTFAHVINADFLASATPVMSSINRVYHQLRELGEFSMLILCDRAQRRGVKNADFIIREGNILPQLKAIISDLRPDTFILGRPVNRGKPTITVSDQELDDFLSEIETNFSIDIMLVDINSENDLAI
jgi:nucleotide-binding universal stress UspA family protein